MGQSHELFDVKFFLATLSLCVQAAVHEGSALASVLPLQGDHSQDCQGGGVQVSSVILQILTTQRIFLIGTSVRPQCIPWINLAGDGAMYMYINVMYGTCT